MIFSFTEISPIVSRSTDAGIEPRSDAAVDAAGTRRGGEAPT